MRRFYETVWHAWNSRVLRAAFSGLCGVVIQTTVFEATGIWLKLLTPSSAVVVGAEFGILTNFTIAHHFVFGDAPKASWFKRIFKFHLVVLGSILIQWAAVRWIELYTTNILALNAAFAAGVLIGFAANYTGYRLWVWRHHTDTTLGLS